MKLFFPMNLKTIGLEVRNQVGIPFVYAEIRFDIGFRLDIIVNDKVIIEIKSVEKLQDVHHKQLLTYLKLTNKKLGLLINFNIISLKYGIVRIVNNLLYLRNFAINSAKLCENDLNVMIMLTYSQHIKMRFSPV